MNALQVNKNKKYIPHHQYSILIYSL